MSHAPVGQRSAHRPQCRQTSSSLTITLPVLSNSETYRSWVRLNAGALSCVAQPGFVVVTGKADAIHRADVDAGIALDADVFGEHGLHIAIQAALRFVDLRLRVEAEFDLHFDAFQRLRFRHHGTL